MKVALIDDEQAAREILREYCAKWNASLDVVGEAGRIQSGIELIRSTRPDLVLLDVEFPEGTGFEVLEAVPDFNFHVIFITAHDDYALEAFKYHALDYILKPIVFEDLKQCLDRAKEHIDNDDKARWNSVIDQLLGRGLERLSVPIKDGYRYVDLNKLVYVKADGSYSLLHLSNNTELLISKRIKWFEQHLCESNFFRVHRSFLVNQNHIVEYHRNDGGYLIMTNNHRVAISRDFQVDHIKV